MPQSKQKTISQNTVPKQSLFKRFLSYYKPVKNLFIKDMLCSIGISVCGMIYPLINRTFVNNYIPNRNMQGIITACIMLFVIFTIRKVLKHYTQYQGHVLGTVMQLNMRSEVFDHLQRLPFSFFDNNKTGAIMSRLTNDLWEVSELAHHGPEDVITSALMLVGSFIILCTINIPLTLIIFSIAPFLVLYAIGKRKQLMDSMTEVRVQVGEINSGIESSISGIRVSKAFVSREKENNKFSKYNNNFLKARKFGYKAMADFYSNTSYILDLLLLAALIASGIFALKQLITMGDFFAFVLYINLFTEPIRQIINFVELLQSGSTGFRRFCDLMDEPIEEENPDAVNIQSAKGDIEFKKVGFKYDAENEVFSDISLKIKSGETVAFVGPSGGGKTTLCHLIPRFYDVDSGEITLNGVNIEHYTRESLRKNIGIVQQDTYLFGGTIAENIAYGNFDASIEEIMEAAKKANIHDYIISLTDGYNTQVGERGVKLSGGQKQRISIARVFLKNPDILILDEATSALDNNTEMLIQNALNELSVGRTTLIVAHRLSTIKHADTIFVITNEGLKESGTHKELIAKNGIYAKLYESNMQIT